MAAATMESSAGESASSISKCRRRTRPSRKTDALPCSSDTGEFPVSATRRRAKKVRQQWHQQRRRERRKRSGKAGQSDRACAWSVCQKEFSDKSACHPERSSVAGRGGAGDKRRLVDWRTSGDGTRSKDPERRSSIPRDPSTARLSLREAALRSE